MTEVEVLVVGAGFSGLAMGCALGAAGRRDFVIVERAGAIGGTWRDNVYPGCACDVPSHLYSFSFAPNPEWSTRFGAQPEILAYLRSVVEAHGLGPHLRLGAAVTGATWDAARARWVVETDGAGTFSARFLVSGTGPLHRASLPDVPGLERFEGPVLHSSRWDAAVPIAGRRVALVGTGASAIQIGPAIAAQVASLTIFQRTPPWILSRHDRPYGVAARRRFARRPWLARIHRAAIYAALESRAVAFVSATWLARLVGALVRRTIRRTFADAPALARAVTPGHVLGCKRVLLSDDWYPTLRRSNVELVPSALAQVGARELVAADGTRRDADVLVLATGFEAAEVALPFPVRGVGGRLLAEAWRDGAEAHLGVTVAGFPNLFLLIGPNTGLGHNSMVFMIESQVRHAIAAISAVERRGAAAIDVRPEAQRRFNTRLQRRLRRTVWATGCASWYLRRDGKNVTLWPGYTFEYRWRTRTVRAADHVFLPRPAG